MTDYQIKDIFIIKDPKARALSKNQWSMDFLQHKHNLYSESRTGAIYIQGLFSEFPLFLDVRFVILHDPAFGNPFVPILVPAVVVYEISSHFIFELAFYTLCLVYQRPMITEHTFAFSKFLFWRHLFVLTHERSNNVLSCPELTVTLIGQFCPIGDWLRNWLVEAGSEA